MKKFLENILKNKRLYIRVVEAILIIGVLLALILLDWEVQFGNLKCGTKSHVNINLNRGN